MSGSAWRSQFSRFAKRRLMLLILKLAIFIVQGQTNGIGQGPVSHLNRLRSTFGCGDTTGTSSVSSRTNNQEVAVIRELIQYYIVVNF